MIDHEDALNMLLGENGALWRSETRHEGTLLLRALYERDAGVRRRIVSAILAGPPKHSLKGEDADVRREYSIFELLAFLQSEGMILLPEGEERLAELKAKHPPWELSPYPGMSSWVEAGWVGRSVVVDDVKSLGPDEIVGRVMAFEGSFDRRNALEAVGSAIGQNIRWGLEVLDRLRTRVHDLPEEAVNPILWGLRAAISDGTSNVERDRAESLLNALGELVEARSVPAMWSSLPSVIKELVGKLGLPVESWNGLAIRLGAMFEEFDYERVDEERPIEWLQRAINHPFGDVAELYIGATHELAQKQAQTNLAVSFEPYGEQFFERMLERYGRGSRYGYCLLTQRLSWVEAVSARLAERLRGVFDWRDDGERTLVAWSGYLWSQALSKRLVEEFETTYVETGRRHRKFGESERRGLTSHVAAVFWFRLASLSQLCKYAAVVNSDLRTALLHGWREHLKSGDPGRAKQLFDEIVYPYWEWCGRQSFFNSPEGDRERFGFWELMPYFDLSFPQAARKAVELRPSSIQFPHLFVRELNRPAMLGNPNELVEVLVALLEADGRAEWEGNEWRRLWEGIRERAPSRLEDLRNMLARRNVLRDL